MARSARLESPVKQISKISFYAMPTKPSNMRIVRVGRVIIGWGKHSAYTESWTKGTYYSLASQVHWLDTTLRTLECLKRLGVINEQDIAVHKAALDKEIAKDKIRSTKWRLKELTEEEDFLEELKKHKDDMPEFLTSMSKDERQFAEAVIKLKSVLE